MAMIQQYDLVASPGREEALRRALAELADAVREQHGCSSAEVFVDVSAPARFLFVEEWESRSDQTAAGQRLGREAFAPVLAETSSKPAVRVLTPEA
ncbi:putative quinol monooxygenase [Sphingomonas sp.]|uniref:putative quinol monooxygenase n=1 Tax=Sphingomonas sp. TaxID=28214 RepID=UPI003B00FF2A